MSQKESKTGVEAVREALKRAPRKPGVYLMKNARGKVIYVGKAKVLKNRLANYARHEEFPGYYRQKVQAMVANVASVEFVITVSEKEALLLENTLIKRYKPRYNVDLRDDKNYLMLKLSREHEFPRLCLVRKKDDKNARYFGPFDRAGAARKTLQLLQRIFPLRRCSDHTLKNRKRPCLDYDTGRCLAPCMDKVSKAEYDALVGQIEAFFMGKGQGVAEELAAQMKGAAEKEEFERAAVLRDRYLALTHTLERQRVSETAGGDQDVFAIYDQGGLYQLAMLRMRAGRVIASRVFDLSKTPLDANQAMAQTLLMIYDEQDPPPPLILLSHLPPDPGLVAEVLAEFAGRKVELRKPQRGEKRGLLDLALLNAGQAREKTDDQSGKVLERLAAKLGLKKPPQWIECVDISHHGGSLTVASLTAMKGGEIEKSLYRRFKVLGLDGKPDDYASMVEVVGRRLKGDRPPPDLLVVDGGKGQLNIVKAALEKAAPNMRPALAALAKGRKEGEPDRVFVPGRKNPVALKPRDPALLLLMHIRDEAHRFAITYHRLLRSKALTRSILEEVPGVGPKRRVKLIKAFGSLAALKKADAGEVGERGGVDETTARRIVTFLRALDSDIHHG